MPDSAVHILLALHHAAGSHEILEGFRRYLKRHRLHWQLTEISIDELRADPASVITGYQADAVVAFGSPPVLAGIAHSQVVPLIDLTGTAPALPKVTHVHCDYTVNGQLAVRYLYSRGYRQFLFLNNQHIHSLWRQWLEGAEQVASGVGCDYHIINDDELVRHPWVTAQEPCVVLASSDGHVYGAAEICREAGLNLPEQIAFLGCGNSLKDCERTQPYLSSVLVPWVIMGEKSAQAVHQWQMHASPLNIRVRAMMVVTRNSTPPVVATDPRLRDVIDHFQQTISEPISLTAYAKAAGISYPTLDRLMRQQYLLSAGDYFHRLRIEKAQRLLLETTMPVPEIATACGYRSRQRFSSMFKQHTGLSPSDLRVLPEQFRSSDN